MTQAVILGFDPDLCTGRQQGGNPVGLQEVEVEIHGMGIGFPVRIDSTAANVARVTPRS